LKKVFELINKYIAELVLILIGVYILMPFLSPIALANGQEKFGEGIQKFYVAFCHQRVERSIFLYGEDGLITFYSISELTEKGYLPDTDPGHDGFGHGYWGNDEIGYKVAFCIRDTAMYGALFLAGVFLVIYSKRKLKYLKLPGWGFALLLLPMMIDGVFQSIAEVFEFDWVSQAYIDNIPKRIITGAMFGVGFAFFVFTNLLEASMEIEEKANKVDSNPKK